MRGHCCLRLLCNGVRQGCRYESDTHQLECATGFVIPSCLVFFLALHLHLSLARTPERRPTFRLGKFAQHHLNRILPITPHNLRNAIKKSTQSTSHHQGPPSYSCAPTSKLLPGAARTQCAYHHHLRALTYCSLISSHHLILPAIACNASLAPCRRTHEGASTGGCPLLGPVCLYHPRPQPGAHVRNWTAATAHVLRSSPPSSLSRLRFRLPPVARSAPAAGCAPAPPVLERVLHTMYACSILIVYASSGDMPADMLSHRVLKWWRNKMPVRNERIMRP